MNDPVLRDAFAAAKERIRGLAYRFVEESDQNRQALLADRFVEESDQNRQALLEIYCAVVLQTPHNDFGTH